MIMNYLTEMGIILALTIASVYQYLLHKKAQACQLQQTLTEHKHRRGILTSEKFFQTAIWLKVKNKQEAMETALKQPYLIRGHFHRLFIDYSCHRIGFSLQTFFLI